MEKECHDLMIQSVLHFTLDTAFLIIYVAGRLHVGSASSVGAFVCCICEEVIFLIVLHIIVGIALVFY